MLAIQSVVNFPV